ncbi:hypothetical protein X474_18965 [Dethiosulfatarculus sandiegensis]|uniref:Uncharacterized protein n=1 Tax=Dethiosulfatarculus sandiegensis TaxID=1429043 RepID=A0A0D2JSE3_9BACT|nr:hypothetical protein X474_18965 [Dethiosulfatarculus sandiegensis]
MRGEGLSFVGFKALNSSLPARGMTGEYSSPPCRSESIQLFGEIKCGPYRGRTTRRDSSTSSREERLEKARALVGLENAEPLLLAFELNCFMINLHAELCSV